MGYLGWIFCFGFIDTTCVVFNSHTTRENNIFVN